MNPLLKNVLAVLAGAAIGMFVNGGIVSLSGSVIPYPEGFDNSDMVKFKETAHLLEAKHMIMPFLAHALGTLVGAFTAAKIAASRHLMMSMWIGFFFLLGGLGMVFMIDQPAWFTAMDLGLAYLPMAWLGWKFAGSPSLRKNV